MNKLIPIVVLIAMIVGTFAAPFQAAEANIFEDNLERLAGLVDFKEVDEEVILSGVIGCAANAGVIWLIGQVPFLEGTKVGSTDSQTNIKKNFIDCVITVAIKGMIQGINQAMIQWAQNGFDGNPSFSQNINQQLSNVAGQEAVRFLDYLNEDVGALICSPFRGPLIEALITYQRNDFEQRIDCSLDEITDNIEGFLSGDFSKGGWDAWLRVTTKDSPYSQYLSIRAELDSRVARSVNKEKTLLDWGSGFLSWETQVCYAHLTDGARIPYDGKNDAEMQAIREEFPGQIEEWSCDSPETATPGSAIESTINDTLLSGRRQLEIADDINEMISALVAYLVQDIVTGITDSDGNTKNKGLAGYDPDDFDRSNKIIPPQLDFGGGGNCAITGPNPADGQAGATIVESMPDFVPAQGNSIAKKGIAIPEGVVYREAVITYQMTVGQITPGALTSMVHLLNPGVKNRYFAAHIFDNTKQGKTIVSLDPMDCNNYNPANDQPWESGVTYDVTIEYSPAKGFLDFQARNTATGQNIIAGAPVTINDIRTFNGGVLELVIGLDKSYGNGGYVPPIGWEFKNIQISLTSN